MADQFEIKQAEGVTIVGTLHDPGAAVGDVLTVNADKSISAAAGGAEFYTVEGGSVIIEPPTDIHLNSSDLIVLQQTAGGGEVQVGGFGIALDPAAGNKLLLHNIPTADPHVVDQVWSNAGVLTLSAG